MYGHPGGHFFWWIPFALLFWFIWLPALIFVLRRGFGGWRGVGATTRTPAPPTPPAEDRALAVLRERFARGEIDRREYEERRATLLGLAPGEGRTWPTD
ncbi:MAG TPA: SHOCT domain-containing protein [Thermomicrobiales bacterium]|nr:SHOCT domain-containing protein [Thermomicrobiales bacterium]